MTSEEEMKILEEINKESIKHGRLLYCYEIKEILDRFITDTECMDEDAKQASIPYTYNAPQHDWKCGYPELDYLHHDSITKSDTKI